MGQKIRTITMLMILFATSSAISTLAEAPVTATQPAQQRQKDLNIRTPQLSEAPDITALLQRVAKLSEFSGWQGATAQFVRVLHNTVGRQNALLYHIQSDGQPAGYVVTTPDGQRLFEFGRQQARMPPEEVESQLLESGYLYAGPMLHLVYYGHDHDGATLDLYNLLTGETLPWGEVRSKVPVMDVAQTSPILAEYDVASSTSTESDALYATGRFGQFQLQAANQKGVYPLQTYAAGDTFSAPSYIVYDAIPGKLYVTLQVTKVVALESGRYVKVQDPFAQDRAAVYIDSRFPVNVFLTESSATYTQPK
ncbi:hypothetical protein CIG75_08240 [Tumebacillus algifaecis]|uniref:Uncharacterized protein n=1 Tax=Tumebacillus algifaecis TaxID=1214604 RepID=A0A223D0U5_9BACL|nr:hypothetical protein [Tumebacillus algifaecis]ASS74977.1 hypothetical protein CIG75_08240 [Tumebacillus algifaecis]